MAAAPTVRRIYLPLSLPLILGSNFPLIRWVHCPVQYILARLRREIVVAENQSYLLHNNYLKVEDARSTTALCWCNKMHCHHINLNCEKLLLYWCFLPVITDASAQGLFLTVILMFLACRHSYSHTSFWCFLLMLHILCRYPVNYAFYKWYCIP
jgi:hypothetical protein